MHRYTVHWFDYINSTSKGNIMKKIIISALMSLGMIANASAAEITLDVPFKPGGFAGTMSTNLEKDLAEMGWKVRVVMSGNCAVTKRNLDSSKDPVAYFWHSRFHLLPQDQCGGLDVPTKDAYVATLYRTKEYLCRSNKTPFVDWTKETGTVKLSIQEHPFQISEVVDYLKRNTNAKVKAIVYSNSGAQTTAMTSGEVDWVMGAVGKQLEINGQAVCNYTTNEKAEGNIKPMTSSFVGFPVIAPSMQYLAVKNMPEPMAKKFREDVNKAIRKSHWTEFMTKRGLVQDLELSTQQQIKMVTDGVTPFKKK